MGDTKARIGVVGKCAIWRRLLDWHDPSRLCHPADA
ncbi:hypothetical protein CI238_02534 [Colletotrichum incanum]|uniref:Uncharacterized protein n=1 Tax=Colletotrichum incanum TaxID=1573173 RepID=A0A167D710_COLIC|nr:hypothetical protein CI238_02534 [Colletotrichum incanum]